MSTEVVKEAKLEEEPRQCTKKEKLGHAIGVLGHDSMYTLLVGLDSLTPLPISLWVSLQTVLGVSGAGFARGFSAQVLLWGSV